MWGMIIFLLIVLIIIFGSLLAALNSLKKKADKSNEGIKQMNDNLYRFRKSWGIK